VALGLEDAARDDAAGLADASVGGREHGGRVGVGEPDPRAQRAGENALKCGYARASGCAASLMSTA